MYLCGAIRHQVAGRTFLFINYMIDIRFTLSSSALSSRLATLARIIGERKGLATADLFAGCGRLDEAAAVAAVSYDYGQVITYYKEARERNNHSGEKTTTRTTKRLTDIIDDIFGSTERSTERNRTTVVAYNQTYGEQGRHKDGEQDLRNRSWGHREAHRGADGGLRTRRGAAHVPCYGAGDGLRALVGGAGEHSGDEVLRGGALSGASRRARDGAGAASRRCAQREHQPASGSDRCGVALWRRRHRPGERAGAWGECRVQPSFEHLKTA